MKNLYKRPAVYVRLVSFLGIVAIGAVIGLGLAGCATTEVRPEGSLVIKIGDLLPPPNPGDTQIADGSYVCSRAEILKLPSLMDGIFGGERITYSNTRYVKPGKSGTKSVAIRINQGKVTEIMAVQQGQGETSKTYATSTVFYSVETPVWVPSGADFDKAARF
ncbi:MAG: hypothetical protein LBB68_10200 [Treponema sp.]|jgi:hypothetical protein|nr:hypothetical protein [Treponema sp.]